MWLGILLVILISYVISYFSLTGITVERFTWIKNQVVRNSFEERIEIKNNSKTPKLWIELIDKSELMGANHSRVITNLKSGKFLIFSSIVVLNRRGLYVLGPTVLKSGDPFGFFAKEKILTAKNHLVVFPKFLHLDQFSINPGNILGGEYLQLHTTHMTPQAASVREYQPGDLLNRIHWPITVIKNKLMVKEFDDDTQSSAWLFLDAKNGIYYRKRGEVEAAFAHNLLPLKRKKRYKLPRDSFEYAVCAAASITDSYIRCGIAVGFVSESKHAYIIPAEKGQRQLMKIMETLSVLENNGSRPLFQIVERQIKNTTVAALWS